MKHGNQKILFVLSLLLIGFTCPAPIILNNPVDYYLTNNSGGSLYLGFAWVTGNVTNIGSSQAASVGTVIDVNVPYQQSTNPNAFLFAAPYDPTQVFNSPLPFVPIPFTAVDSNFSYGVTNIPEPGFISFFFIGGNTICDLAYSALSTPFNASMVFLVGGVACLLMFKWSKRAVQPGQTYTRYKDSSGRWRGRHH